MDDKGFATDQNYGTRKPMGAFDSGKGYTDFSNTYYNRERL